jgi:hypothetical protein
MSDDNNGNHNGNHKNSKINKDNGNDSEDKINEEEDGTHVPNTEEEKSTINEDRALEIINVEFSTLSDFISKEIKKLKNDCFKLIDKTKFETKEEDEN